MVTFSSIIGHWKSAEEFSRDLGLKTYSHGRTMKRRNSIPVAHWPKVLEAAKARNLPVTLADLMEAQMAREEK